MQTWRRIEKIRWTEHKTDGEVLDMITEERALIILIRIMRAEEMDWIHALKRLTAKNGYRRKN